MRVVNSYPPNYPSIIKVFDLTGKTPVFTYGDTIYSPYVKKLDPDLIVHEAVHMKQQGDNPHAWWTQYLEDPHFRLMQEIEAYRAQFKFYKAKNKTWMPFLRRIIGDLSGAMYGNVISFSDAMSLIMKP